MIDYIRMMLLVEYLLNVCIFSAFLRVWHHFTARERFYGDVIPPATIQCS